MFICITLATPTNNLLHRRSYSTETKVSGKAIVPQAHNRAKDNANQTPAQHSTLPEMHITSKSSLHYSPWWDIRVSKQSYYFSLRVIKVYNETHMTASI